jgi:hypothetical protein
MTSLRIQPRGYGNENLILEKLHHEAIQIHSIDAKYIPRTLVNEDTILGEDRLSEFKNSYPVDVYIQNVEGFTGSSSFASSWGLQNESSATILISRRGWENAVAKYGTTILPNRPAEGDLIYLPLNDGLFEIMYCDHQAPFYQLGQYYSYKLTIELFRYSSEKMDTGVSLIDKFETVHSTDVTVNPDLSPLVRGADNKKFTDRADDIVFDTNNPFGEI